MNTNEKLSLKVLRVKAGMRQIDVAKKIGVSESTISKWENGTTFPDVPKICQLEKLFNVGYSDIKFFDKEHGLTV